MQAYANMQNAQTDFVIGVVNLSLIQYNSALGIYNALAGTDYQLGITAPDWSRGLFWDEPGEAGEWNDTHGWSKFAAGVSLESGLAAATLGGSAAGSTSLRQIPGKVAGYAKSLPGKAQNAWAGIKSWWKGTPKAKPNNLPGCFLAGTPVSLYRPENADLRELTAIESVRQGDMVWACNPRTGKWEPKQVLQALTRQYSGDIITITYDGGETEATGNHPV